MEETHTDSTEQATTVAPTPTVAPAETVTPPTKGTPINSEPTTAPAQPVISNEGKSRLEAEAKYLLDNPERLEYMKGLLAEKTADPVAELRAEFELRDAKKDAIIAHPELKDYINSIAGTTPAEIRANAEVLAKAITPAQGLPTEVGTTTTPLVGTEPAPVEAPAQAGTPLPTPPSISEVSPLRRSMKDIRAQLKAQGEDPGAGFSAR